MGEVSRKFRRMRKTVTVGGLYTVDHLINVKAKLNSNIKLGALPETIEIVTKILISRLLTHIEELLQIPMTLV